MSSQNTDHSHVRYSIDGTPVCWSSRNGTYHTPPVPAEIIAIDPPRHLSPIGATHPGTAANCLWCKGLIDDSAMERCGIDDSSHSEPGMQGGSRQAVASVPCLICQRPVYDYEPERCCNGQECGCMGQPTNPCVCSDECDNALMKHIGMPFDERRIKAGIELWKPAVLPKPTSGTSAIHGPPLWLGWFFLGLMVLATGMAIGACVWR